MPKGSANENRFKQARSACEFNQFQSARVEAQPIPVETMSIFKKNVFLFAVVNFTLLSVPVFLAGCGGANTDLASNAVTAGGSNGSSASSGSSSGSKSGSSGSSSGAGSSGSSGSSSSSSSGSSDSVPARALKVTGIQKLRNWDG